MARRSRDGEEQAAEKRAKMQRRSGFYIRRLPPVAYGSRPPIPEGGNGHRRLWEKPRLPCCASVLRLCVILSVALCA